MNLDSKIYVAGHRGLVGSALMWQLQAQGYSKLITRTHAELELTDQAAVREFFEQEKPEYVFLAAAKVGGGCCQQHLSSGIYLFQPRNPNQCNPFGLGKRSEASAVSGVFLYLPARMSSTDQRGISLDRPA